MKMIGLVVVFALGVCGLALLLAVDCENTIKAEIRSPDGKYTATLYERDCGATTAFSTIVNLRESSIRFNGDDLGVVIVKGQHGIDLVWDSNTRVQLQCQDCRGEDVFKQERNWKDVEIAFVR